MPSDVFRPRLPLDPFAAVDVRAPWLVPHSLPHSPPQVILILGEPPASELLPLLTSPHLARSLLLLASHAPPALPLLPPTTPGPAVRILRLPAPLAVHDAGALRLVALLEKAHRVAARWRQASPPNATPAHAHASSLSSFQPSGTSSWAVGPGKAHGATPAWSGVASGSAADRVVQLAEAPKTGEFVVVEPVLYLPPPTSVAGSSAAADPLHLGSTAAGAVGLGADAQGSSADPRTLSSYNNPHHRHHAGSATRDGTPPRPSPLPTNAPQYPHQQHLQQQQEARYPSPTPSVAESLSSASHHPSGTDHPKKDGLPLSTSSSLPSSTSSASTLAAPETSLKAGNKSNSKRFSALSPSSPSPDVSPMSSPVGPPSSQSLSSLSPSPSTLNAKKLRRSIRSAYSSSSLSLSLSSSTSHSKDISPFAASVTVKSKGSVKNKGAAHTGTERAFDAILNFLPQGVPDKQLLKHAILVTTLGARYLEGEGGSPGAGGAGHGHSHNYGPSHDGGYEFGMVDSLGRSSASASSSMTSHHPDAGYVSDTGTIHNSKRASSRRFSAFSVFSFASTTASTPLGSVGGTPRSTPDLLGVAPGASRPGSAGSVSLAPTSAHGHGQGQGQGRTPGSSLRARPQSAYSASAYEGSADAHGEEDADGEVEVEVEVDAEVEVEVRSGKESGKEKEKQRKRKSVRKRISAFLGGGASSGGGGGGGVEGRERESEQGMETGMIGDKELRRPDMVRCGEGSRRGSVYGAEGDVEEEMGGKAKRASFFGGGGGGGRSGHERHGRETQVMTAHIVHVLPAGWIDWESSSPAPSRRNSSNLGVEMMKREYGVGKGKGKPKLVQSVEQFLLSFAYPLGSLGGAGPGSGSVSNKGKENRNGLGHGPAPRPPPSAYPGARSSSSGAVELQQYQHKMNQHNQQPHEGRLAALARQHRPVPYLVAPGVFGAVISCSASSSSSSSGGDTHRHRHLVLPHALSNIRSTDNGHGCGYGPRALTHGEAILLGALDVDPASGSWAGTGRAWVGVGDVRFVDALANEAPPVPALPAAVLASSRFHPQTLLDSADRRHIVVHQLDDKAKEKEKKMPTTLVGRSPDSQLPTPPESGSSSGESVEGEDREDDVEDEEDEAAEKEAEKQKEEARDGERDLPPPPPRTAVAPHRKISNTPSSKSHTSSKTSSDAQSQSDTHALSSGLQRRPTRNHRPAPPPPSVPSPVRAALENLALSHADPAPPPRVIALPERHANATTKAAFPAVKEGAVEAMTEDLTPPARPRTIHVSDAHRSPPVPVGVVGLNRSASQSTSALLRGGAKEREREKNGHGKGYAHGFQAAWKRLVVWRGREKGAQKA